MDVRRNEGMNGTNARRKNINGSVWMGVSVSNVRNVRWLLSIR